jgi:hypothetical protein
MANGYVCFVCCKDIDPETEDVHSLPTGEDCHAACCSVCNPAIFN